VAASPFAEGAHVEEEEGEEDRERVAEEEKAAAVPAAKAEAEAAVSRPLAPISTTAAVTRPSSASDASLPPSSSNSNATTATTPAAAVAAASRSSAPARVRSRFVERFSMGAPFAGGVVVGPAIESVEDRVSWVEQFLERSSGDGGGGGGEKAARGEDAAARAAGPAARAGRARAGSSAEEDDEAVAKAEAAAEAAEAAAAAAAASRGPALSSSRPPLAPPSLQPPSPSPPPLSSSSSSLGLHVGVLHFSPGLEPFPLLADPAGYAPDTLDVAADRAELDYWLGVLRDQVPQVVEKAVSSENAARRQERRRRGEEEEEGHDGTEEDGDDASAVEATRRRGAAMGRALAAHLARLHADPAAYGALALSDVFELREECLREFGFADVYALDKRRENAAALEALPQVLAELDAAEAPPPLLRLAQQQWQRRKKEEAAGEGRAGKGRGEGEGEGEEEVKEIDPASAVRRLEALIEGSLAANIFDWGARACVELYEDSGNGSGCSVLGMYRGARENLRSLRRPWRVDTFDELAAVWRKAAAERMNAAAKDNGGNLSPPPPPPVPRPPFKRAIIFVDNAGADVVLGILPLARELLAWGCDVVLAANAAPAINDVTERELRAVVAEAAGGAGGGGADSRCCCPLLAAAAAAGDAAEAAAGGRIPPVPGLRARVPSVGSRLFDLGGGGEGGAAAATARPAASTSPPPPPLFPLASSSSRSPDGSPPASPSDSCSVPPAFPLPGVGRLFVCSNGQGSPCLDLRRVPGSLADACVGADLVVVEGMGRAIHTNFRARFAVSSLKLAMIKNAHLAEALLGGEIMDCVCLFETGVEEES